MTASRESRSVDASLVAQVIASGFPTLRFPTMLERLFERETGQSRSLQLVVRGLAGIALSILVLIVDWQLTPDVFDVALWLRLAVIAPISVAIALLLRRNPPPVLRETMVCLICVLASVSSLWLMHLSESPLRDGQHYTVILVILFITMVQRIRFPYAVASCLMIFAIYATAMVTLEGYAPGRVITDVLVFGFTVVLALIASYSLEHELRLSYLLGLRERLRNSDLESLSRVDALTGLDNRRSLDEALTDLDAGTNEDQSCGFILLDIDHFKSYNDTLGHMAGDVCLKRLAGIVQAQLRTGADIAFRFGGEEFLVLLPAADLSTAVSVAERIRRCIEDAAIPHPARAPGVVTASLGVASAKLGGAVTAEELIASADAALYAAKRNGRNQVWPRFAGVVRGDMVALPDRRSRQA